MNECLWSTTPSPLCGTDPSESESCTIILLIKLSCSIVCKNNEFHTQPPTYIDVSLTWEICMELATEKQVKYQKQQLSPRGIKKTNGAYIEICDRKEAIAYAIHHGEPGDVIVLAGKGHEDYQEIKGVKYPMDERILIEDIRKEDRK